eukprot:355368-Chlamydomonas_euryale.AAC.28
MPLVPQGAETIPFAAILHWMPAELRDDIIGSPDCLDLQVCRRKGLDPGNGFNAPVLSCQSGEFLRVGQGFRLGSRPFVHSGGALSLHSGGALSLHSGGALSLHLGGALSLYSGAAHSLRRRLHLQCCPSFLPAQVPTCMLLQRGCWLLCPPANPLPHTTLACRQAQVRTDAGIFTNLPILAHTNTPCTPCMRASADPHRRWQARASSEACVWLAWRCAAHATDAACSGAYHAEQVRKVE